MDDVEAEEEAYPKQGYDIDGAIMEGHMDDNSIVPSDGGKVTVLNRRKKRRGARRSIMPTKIISPDIKLGTNPSGRKKERPVGYYPAFPISKDIYTNIINSGSPFICPPCEKRFKQRTSFDNHLYNRCFGKPDL